MLSYTIRRLLVTVPTVLGALTFLFFLYFLLPGDPAKLIAGGSEKAVNEQVLKNVEARYGFDRPIPTQYGDYLGRTVTGDLGESYLTRENVSDVVKDRSVNSVRLAIWAVIIEVIVGIGVGLWSAMRRYSFSDKFTTVFTAAASAIPAFVLGFVLQQIFAVRPVKADWPAWATLKVQGIGPDTWTFFFIPTGEQWRYLILPAITLASVSTALAARMMRGSMLEVNQADYMRTARAKGLRQRDIVVKHGLRNALIPVVTLIGIDFGTVLGAAVLTETVFNWPGLGSKVATAVDQRDAPVVLGLTLVIVVAYSLINLLVDLSYAYFDPRIRLGKEAET